MTKRFCWLALAAAGILFATPSAAELNLPDREPPDIELDALMSGHAIPPTAAMSSRSPANMAAAGPRPISMCSPSTAWS